MVTCVKFRVDFALIRCHVLGTEHVVNPHMHPMSVIGRSHAVAGSNIAIGQVFSDGMAGIRQRMVVEVATHQDGVLPMLVNVLAYSLCGRSPEC